MHVTKGTKSDPWELTTPPGSSTYSMYRDPDGDPPALVCVVGSTTLKYHLSAIDDLHAWLVAQGRLGRLGRGGREQAGRRRHGRSVGPIVDQSGRRLVRTAQGLPRTIRDVSPPFARSLGLAEVTHDARNNQMRAL